MLLKNIEFLTDYLYATPDGGNFFVTCLARIMLAMLCGAVIGYERTRRQKGAGIRTHVIISLGAVAMMLVSKYGFYDQIGIGLNADATRIASNIMTGMGFIGAGVIFVKNTSIKGLTTAAGLWATTGVAMAIGTGLYEVGVMVTAIMLLSQVLLHVWFRSVDTAGSTDLTVTLRCNEGAYDRLKEQLTALGAFIETCKLKRDGETTLRVVAKIHDGMNVEEVLAMADANEDIISIEV